MVNDIFQELNLVSALSVLCWWVKVISEKIFLKNEFYLRKKRTKRTFLER